MSLRAVLSPVFLQILLTFLLFVVMGVVRARALQARDVHISDVALGNEAWPARVKQISNSFHNQLELPLLYFALVPMAVLANRADGLFVFLSWVFVALRYGHAYIHVTSNHVPMRFNVFAAGALVLALMWIWFAAQVLINL